MKKVNKRTWLISFAVFFLLLAWVLEKTTLDEKRPPFNLTSIQRTIIEKENQVLSIIEQAREQLDKQGVKEFFEMNAAKYDNLLREKGLAFTVYKDDTLVFWSDNSLPVENFLDSTIQGKKFLFKGNAWYCKLRKKSNSFVFYGYILVKYEYPYQNRFLKNRFHASFNIPYNVVIVTEKDSGHYQVKDSGGNHLFSVKIDETMISTSRWGLYIPSLLYFIALMFFLGFLGHAIGYARSSRKQVMLLFLLFPLLFFIKYILSRYQIPRVWYMLELFKPIHFATSNLLPSLGDFIISTLFFYIFFLNFHKYFRLPDSFYNRGKTFSTIVSILSLAAIVGCFVLVHYLFRSIIINSSITFEAYDVLEIDIYTMFGILAISLLLAGFSLFTDRILKNVGCKLKFWNSLGLFSFLVLIATLILYLTGCPVDLFSFLFLVLLFAFFRWLYERERIPYKYSTFITFAFFYALFSTTLINYYSVEKEKNHKKLTAITLSSEHDPVAELLLDRVETMLKNDQEIKKYLFDDYFFYEDLYNYLRKKYFNGYWTKYDLQLTLCAPGDSVLIEPDMEKHPCHHFFHDMLEEFAVKLPNCCFYYLDNANGSISYFGAFNYMEEESGSEITLYIQLDSKLITAELGYPELLLEDKMLQGITNNKYAYAKYFDHRLISQTGNFPYSLKDDVFARQDEEFYYVRFDSFIHLVYRVDESNTIVISSPSVKFIDLLISFSYIFLLFFILITLALLVLNVNTIKRSLQFNFKNRIQFTMISILFLSLLVVGGGTVYYSLQQYKNKHFEILGEKIQSVYIELIHKFELEHEITSDWHTKSYGSLEELLKKFSNVFYTDINLYDKNGNLLATSREEIFDRGLLGNKMHPMAFKALSIESRTEFIHNEKIGGLEYISAYVPFMNSNNQLLAYLNLPYFTKQNLLTREISTLVVTVVNIYVLLILLSLFLAVVISNKITYPLRLLQDKFRKMKLGKKDEPIHYKGDDEIGSLVNEYNRMVKELANSVELLARTEREFAWREMAKQIAHEIKNPLTPMKLCIQQMQRAWNNKDENWEEQLQKVSKTLIEEIENLAQIATEFSNFAKIPKTFNSEFNVLEVLDSTLQLYENNKQVEIKRDYTDFDGIFILADKEQIRRVFINLISNAIQSIPADKNGKLLVNVTLNEEMNSMLISFKDNGKGIADEIKDRLFQPNFTTKSSGMGLGLAIVKNIIDNAGGSISYRTRLDEGTTFIVELPIIKYK